ncbi:MAG: hypothetical protein HY782_27165 [Chloroflexi bacterium]|nr:hypothetical protein [Chloroflexota bacterium]
MNLDSKLTQLENAQLVRRIDEPDLTFLFKHALTQESAYQSLLREDRKRLHRAAGQALERAYPEQLDEIAALLAQHFELGEDQTKALEYLDRAAEWARRGAAHREELQLLERALAIAEQMGNRELAADFHARRGRAFAMLTMWKEAKHEQELALQAIAPAQIERRAEVLVDLAMVTQLLWNTADSTHYAEEALGLAEQAGRRDLAAGAMSTLAVVQVSDGHPKASLETYERAFALAGGTRNSYLSYGMDMSGLALYWIGQHRAAIQRNREALRVAREIYDSQAIMRGLGNLGLALMASGEYGEAIKTFDEAVRFGKQHEIGAWLARAMAMRGGLYLELSDYARAEAIAEEARATSRAVKFPPAAVSAAIDLLLNYARRGELGRADHLVREVAQAIPATYGSHRWLWELRFTQARAELALARYQWEEARAAAEEALARSRATNRVKYEVAALGTRAQALLALNRKGDAIADLKAAVELARPVGDPTMFLRAATARLHVQGDDALAAEARAAVRRIAASLPDEQTRLRFEAFQAELI